VHVPKPPGPDGAVPMLFLSSEPVDRRSVPQSGT